MLLGDISVEVFPFFARRSELEDLTPPWLHFGILTPLLITMREGTQSDYRIHLHGVPLRWRSCIVEWEPPWRFVDVQEPGPYRLWVHTDSFEQVGEGTLARDSVAYSVLGGDVTNNLFVARNLRRIFRHRAEVLNESLWVSRLSAVELLSRMIRAEGISRQAIGMAANVSSKLHARR